MKRPRVCTAALALLGFAVPAGAQSGATWVDAHGRMVSIEFAGGGEAPAPADRPAAEMAALFKRLCLDSGGGEEGLAKAAATAGLTAHRHDIRGDRVMVDNTIPLRVWTGEGLAVSRTDGFLGVRLPQCSASFYASTLPARPAVTSALSKALGAQPSNAAAATDKKGKPKNNYTPEWTVAGPSGPLIVTAIVIQGGQHAPLTPVLLSVRSPKKPGK